jgi:3-methylfumaryl-CoA hydratase
MAIVGIRHELRPVSVSTPAVVETQTFILLGADARPSGKARASRPIETGHRQTVVPDATLLFQFSALGFNSHKIHIDRSYAREVEGLPDLVVNGGLSTLLSTELLRTELGLTPTRIATRNTAPLFCGRPITLAAVREGARWRLGAYDDSGQLAVDMEADVR